jgi:hypothetical protein
MSAPAIEDFETIRRRLSHRLDRYMRDTAYLPASDAKAGMCAEAGQRHSGRMAGMQRHFGQQIGSRGNPGADHAQAFVAAVRSPVDQI